MGCVSRYQYQLTLPDIRTISTSHQENLVLNYSLKSLVLHLLTDLLYLNKMKFFLFKNRTFCSYHWWNHCYPSFNPSNVFGLTCCNDLHVPSSKNILSIPFTNVGIRTTYLSDGVIHHSRDSDNKFIADSVSISMTKLII